jgi:hypothetical protein
MEKEFKKGAKCPGCDWEWLWDGCQDGYTTPKGEWCESSGIFDEQPGEGDGIQVTMFQCPNCRIILGFSCNDPVYGGPVFNHPEWEHITGDDWLDKFHV